MGGEFLDADHEASQTKMNVMGINPQYFLAVGPDPR
jgi:hypothetical protein